MGFAANKIELADQAPSEDALTAYDEANFRLYMYLLNAEASNIPHDGINREFLEIDAMQEPWRARDRLRSLMLQRTNGLVLLSMSEKNENRAAERSAARGRK